MKAIARTADTLALYENLVFIVILLRVVPLSPGVFNSVFFPARETARREQTRKGGVRETFVKAFAWQNGDVSEVGSVWQRVA